MTNQLNKESIKSRLDRIRQTSSNGDNSPINSISEVKEESKAISTKETSEMRNEFESVLQSGNMTKDKFAYFIQCVSFFCCHLCKFSHNNFFLSWNNTEVMIIIFTFH